MRNAAIELINSEHRHDGQVHDSLDNAEWLERFRARWNISRPVSHRQFRQLRGLLRKITEQLAAEQEVSDLLLDGLNAALKPWSVQDRVVRSADGSFQRQSVPAGLMMPGTVVVRAFLKLLADGDWRRLKVCANSACRWVFYDESRNRVRIWCDSTLCGNVMKVRRFRERNRKGFQNSKVANAVARPKG